QERHIAYREGKEIKIPPRVQDSVSVYYYLRTLNLRAGDVIEVPINCGRHNYFRTLKVKGEERIYIKGGHHQALILIPQSLTLEGETKRKGQATAYLSVTEKTLLLANISRAGIFSAQAVLIEWKKF
ncbi:DUF3108 domain-containing protein, partial [bacterium]|nr:DUF3108 domain-containing protein [bacterium]